PNLVLVRASEIRGVDLVSPGVELGEPAVVVAADVDLIRVGARVARRAVGVDLSAEPHRSGGLDGHSVPGDEPGVRVADELRVEERGPGRVEGEQLTCPV